MEGDVPGPFAASTGRLLRREELSSSVAVLIYSQGFLPVVIADVSQVLLHRFVSATVRPIFVELFHGCIDTGRKVSETNRISASDIWTYGFGRLQKNGFLRKTAFRISAIFGALIAQSLLENVLSLMSVNERLGGAAWALPDRWEIFRNVLSRAVSGDLSM